MGKGRRSHAIHAPGTSYGYDQSLIGRLCWLAELRRGLLATFDLFYPDTRGLAMLRRRSTHQKANETLTLTPNLLRELVDIFSILQLAFIRVRDSVWTTIIAFDTSVTAEVVKYARTNNTAAEGLLRIAIKREVSSNKAPWRNQDVE